MSTSRVRYYVRPHMNSRQLPRFFEVCGLTPQSPSHLLVVRGLGRFSSHWLEVGKSKLEDLFRHSEFIYEHDYVVCSRSPDSKQGALKRREFLEHLFPLVSSNEPKKAPGGNLTKHEYFVHSAGPYRDTVIDLLIGLGEPCEDRDLVSLPLGLGRKIQAWPIKRETMKVLALDQRLNSWRGSMFYRRLKIDRGGRAEQVPSSFFSSLKKSDALRHVRRALAKDLGL